MEANTARESLKKKNKRHIENHFHQNLITNIKFSLRLVLPSRNEINHSTLII